MAFHTAKYDVFVFLGDPNCVPLWHWKAWQRLVPTFDALMQAARGKPAVRTTQYVAGSADILKVGRLGWNDADHQKWTHASPVTKRTSKRWTFLDVEVWAPTWTVSEREDRAPDIFLSVYNQTDCKKPHFNPVIIFAVILPLAKSEAAQVAAAVTALRDVTRAKLVGQRRRPWGISSHGGFTNAIQDLSYAGLLKPGPINEVGFGLFTEKWRPVR